MKWQTYKLKLYAEVKHGFAFKSQFFNNSGEFVLLTPGNFNEEGGFRWLHGKQKYYIGEIPSDYILRKHDLLVAMTEQAPGLLGSVILIPENGKYLHNQRLGLVKIFNEELFKYFLYHVFNSHIVRKPISEMSSGTKVKHSSPEQIGNIFIPVPPINQQIAIANMLSTWDSAIEKTERLITTKEMQLSAFSQQLFGKSTGWKLVYLRDILDEHGHSSTGREEVFSVSVHKGLINQIKHLGRSFSAKDTSNYNRVHFGDIVFTKSPTGDFPYGIIKQSLISEDVIVSPLYGVFSPVSVELGTILDLYFSSPVNTSNYLLPLIQKGAKNTINITNKTFLSAKLKLPMNYNEQKQIARLIISARHEIDLLKKQAAAFRKQKRGLMQKLLTGLWRVRQPEECKEV